MWGYAVVRGTVCFDRFTGDLVDSRCRIMASG